MLTNQCLLIAPDQVHLTEHHLSSQPGSKNPGYVGLDTGLGWWSRHISTQIFRAMSETMNNVTHEPTMSMGTQKLTLTKKKLYFKNIDGYYVGMTGLKICQTN